MINTFQQSTRRKLTFVLLLLFWCQPSLAQAELSGAAQENRSYVLDIGDVIEVTVYGEDDLSMPLEINGTGVVNYSFVGRLALLGKTVAVVEQEITELLKGDYLLRPEVSVMVTKYRPFFIMGMVLSPGSYPYQPGLTVRRAITIAGGLTPGASSSKWYLIAERASKDARHKVSEDDPVNPGDTITIEESFF